MSYAITNVFLHDLRLIRQLESVEHILNYLIPQTSPVNWTISKADLKKIDRPINYTLEPNPFNKVHAEMFYQIPN